MTEEYITIYLTNIWWNDAKKEWDGGITMYRPTLGKYYVIKIPIPYDVAKNKLGEIISEKPELNN